MSEVVILNGFSMITLIFININIVLRGAVRVDNGYELNSQ